MTLELLQQCSRGCVPEPDIPVFACRRHQLTIRRECHGLDPAGMASIVCSGALVVASQSLTVLSPTGATSLLSGENATARIELEWPLSVCGDAPMAASQSLTVVSSDANLTSLPSSENVTVWTILKCPSSVCSECLALIL